MSPKDSRQRVKETKPPFLKLRRAWFLMWQALVFALLFCGIFALCRYLYHEHMENFIIAVLGMMVLLAALVLQFMMIDPNRIRARQTDDMLNLANDILESIRDGITFESAQKVCDLLLPATKAMAVAVTDKEVLLGYAGYRRSRFQSGSPISTKAAFRVIDDATMRIMYSSEETDFPKEFPDIRAGVIVPLMYGDEAVGTVEFYYRRAWLITETQISIAKHFGGLISLQIAALAFEKERKASAEMKLKVLQSQINPHFLFNTINTVSSYIRTDPEKARRLLREIATFYRSTLDNSAATVKLSCELEQTERYFLIERARFGDGRVALELDIDQRLNDLLIPPFVIQPLVENSIHHALPSEGLLKVKVLGEVTDYGAVIRVIDDGRGMMPQRLAQIMHPQSSIGLGIAMNNVNERICATFDEGTRMEVKSSLDVGTTVSLMLHFKENAFERGKRESG